MAKEERATDDGDEIDLAQLALTVWKGKFIVAALMAVALFLGAFYLANTAPTYQADALLQLESRQGQLALPTAMQGLMDNAPQSTTEIEVIRSRMVLGQVVAALHTDWIVTPDLAPVIGEMLARYNLPLPSSGPMRPYVRVGESLSLSLLTVPPRWINQSMPLTVTETGYTITLPDGQTLTGTVGTTLATDTSEFAINVESLTAAPGRRFFIKQVDELSAIGNIRSRLSVSEVGRGSGILRASLKGPNRRENIRVLNAIVQTYIQQNIARSAAEAESSLQFINAQLPQAEQSLRQAEAALNDYRQQQDSVDLTFETQNLLTQITALENQLADLQQREDEIRQRYTPSHPTYRQLLDDRQRLEARLAELRSQAEQLPGTQRDILNLTRNVELAQGIYTQLLTRAQEVQVVRASAVGSARLIDTAASSLKPVAPRKSMILALSLILGMLAGIAVVLLRNWLRKGVQDASEIEAVGLPVFATINYTEHADTKQRRDGRLDILALSDPTDLSVEAFRSLRTSLHFGMLDAQSHALAITSSHPGAGKSFTSVNLAVVAAQAGQRVCLIDADLRRGQLRRYFGIARHHPGLAELLAGDAALEDCIVPGPIDNLSVITTGRYPPNPAELLMRATLPELIRTLDEHFDLILLDCPPVLAVTDPVIIARAVGSTILIARHDTTPLGEVEAAIKTFEVSAVKLTGAVLNGFDPKKAKAGYGYGYGYRYDYKKRED